MKTSTDNKTAGKFTGLSEEQADIQRDKFGSNEITSRKRKSFFRKFMESFGDPIIKILLIVLAINIIILFKNFDWYESAGIAFAILIATFVSTISEYGNESAFEKLQTEAAKILCKVQRKDGMLELPIGEIVVDDLIMLQTGDKVPADGIIISGEIDVDQSALNGETKEIHKSADSAENAQEGFMNPREVYRGTVVCSGEAVMKVTSVGDNTFYGKLAAEMQEETRKSPMKERLERLASNISTLGYIGAAVVAAANLFNSIFVDHMFDFAAISQYLSIPANILGLIIQTVTLSVIVIVVAVPEGLPMMITIVLSANMRRMLKDNVLVRKLVGIETAGSLNILFTDKTGTLTYGKLKVHNFLSGDARLYNDIVPVSNDSELWRLLYTSITVNNGAVMSADGIAIGGNATDRALLEFADRHKKMMTYVEKLEQIPFDSKRKYSTAQISGAYSLTLIKGAPEKILGSCTHYYDNNGMRIRFTTSGLLREKMRKMANESMRFIAVATSDFPIHADKSFPDLTLLGLIGIRDEIRKEAKTGVLQVKRAGVQIVMITGDNADTANAIARETGILETNGISMTSSDISKLSDYELKKKLPDLCVLSRALPSDKSRLVRLAQELNFVTGMTGDGVNDAPALKKADVGFAMGSGTEVAKEAGDIVILDDNFISISKAILYGRTIFKSIRKFIIFQLTVNLCAVGLSIIGPVIGIDTPVTVLQMLWINMVMDTLAGIAFSGEPPLNEYMLEKPKKREENIINSYMLGEILITGTYIILLCLAYFKIPLFSSFVRRSDNGIYFMTAFFAIFMFTTIFNSFNARTPDKNLFSHINQNPLFIIVMGIICVVQIGLLYFGGTLFRTASLTAKELLVCITLAFSVIPVDLLRKRLLPLKTEECKQPIHKRRSFAKPSFITADKVLLFLIIICTVGFSLYFYSKL